MSEIIREEANGTISITDDAVAAIAGVAAEEVEGVVSMNSNLFGEIAGKFGKKGLNKNIKVDVSDNEITVEVHVVLKYGANIPKICDALQDRISSSVDNMTGIKVKTVNVFVENIVMEKKEKAPKAKKIEDE